MRGWPNVDPITAVGRVLSGRYLIEGWLGSGGMASVWRGRDLRLDRAVAIKELAGPWLDDPSAVQRFDREARTAAGLAHPNIVAVHDVGIHDTSRYLVMELIEGPTVAQMLANGPVPVVAAIAIAAQTCDGLAAAHAAGVIHRDVKPANLMLSPAGVVKICDFGIARALFARADSNLTGPRFAMGTSAYMAPEQAHGECVDARADLYALGCTMYAMLAGAPPFHGRPAEVLQQHLNQPPVPLRQHRAEIPPELEALVAHLLAKAPAARPADTAEVKARLVAMLDDPTAAVVPVSGGSLVAVPRAALPGVARPPRAPSSAASVGARGVAPVRRPSSAANRRVAPVLSAAAVIIALTATLLSFLASRQSTPSEAVNTVAGVPTPAATSVAAVTPSQAVTEPLATRSARSSRAVQPGIQAPPVEPIAAMRLSIQQQVSTGNLNPDKASDLYTRVDAIAKAVGQGNAGDAAKNIKAMRDKLASLRAEGKLTASGYDALIRDLDSIAASLP